MVTHVRDGARMMCGADVVDAVYYVEHASGWRDGDEAHEWCPACSHVARVKPKHLRVIDAEFTEVTR